MSEQKLCKVEAEVAKLEKELEMYKKAITKDAAIEALINYIKATEEPFSSDYNRPNPFHQTPGGSGGGCCG